MRLFSYWMFILVMLLLLTFVPPAGSAEHAIAAGYGFGFLNVHKRTLHIEGERKYDFFQASYLYERPCHYPKVALVLEPFAAYINRPNDGMDVGLNAGIKWYPFGPGNGFYISPQTGLAYTTIKFKEQGTHLLFVLQATFGYRYKDFFIEDRFKHYSNGHTADPNRSVHANIVVVGMYF